MAFEKLAQTHLKLDSRLEAASSYVEAAKCYQKTNKAGRVCCCVADRASYCVLCMS